MCRGKYLKVIVGGSIFLALVFTGIFAPYICPHDPQEQHLEKFLRPPVFTLAGSRQNVFGTDNLGRDLLSRIIYGSRISLLVGVISVSIAAIVGSLFGAVAGYFGGYVDEVIMKIVEIFLAFPFLLLAIVIMAFLGQGLDNLILALVLSRWVHFCRIVRGEVLSLKERDHVMAAKAIGASDFYIIRRHILPNAVPTILVVGTFAMALVIIYEASLSFLGLGVPASIPTWGGMLSEGRSYMYSAPWLCIIPGLAIFLTVLGINLFGDGLRDLLDPRLRGQI
ncbi:MAG: ABC transporter permease [Deltaproteobacteria bacterium]|nr:ABC transporter permease [Deltaproteobacteria bacterium]